MDKRKEYEIKGKIYYFVDAYISDLGFLMAKFRCKETGSYVNFNLGLFSNYINN